MFLSSSRPTAFRLTRRLGFAAGACFALLGLSATPALAAATCEGQTFSQPFAAWNDYNYYTLVQGGEFNSASEGWELKGGAQILQSRRPNRSTAGVLNLPSGSEAVSPPVCVTLQYKTARVWVRNVKGTEGVAVSVAYAGTPTATSPMGVGLVHGAHSCWTLSDPFNLEPQTAGPNEGTRQVRLVFLAGGQTSDFQLYGLYVDPRMKR
jgi:hypothetical protein